LRENKDNQWLGIEKKKKRGEAEVGQGEKEVEGAECIHHLNSEEEKKNSKKKLKKGRSGSSIGRRNAGKKC